jgi:hypothetical protein
MLSCCENTSLGVPGTVTFTHDSVTPTSSSSSGACQAAGVDTCVGAQAAAL